MVSGSMEYSYQVKWTPSSSASLGSYTYDVYLTYRSTVLDSSIGNTVKVEPMVKTGEIISVEDAPDPLTRPGTATFTVTVKNTGNFIWSSGKVTVKIHKPASTSVYTTKSLSISNIAPGAEYTYNVKWAVSSYATTGTYTYDVYFYYRTSTLIDSDVGNPSNTITIN
jgi:archaellum component FlaG (FlaF/FlaG flagellin family)